MPQMTTRILAGLAMAGTLATPPGAQPQTMICGQRDAVLAQLRDAFGEERRAIGLAPRNRIVEIFASDTTGSWTITVTSVDGITCLIAAGEHYEAIRPRPAGEPL